MELQMELQAALADPQFQNGLRQLAEESDNTDNEAFLQRHRAYLLHAYCAVLPNYGFEPSQFGVAEMMAAFRPFTKDRRILKMHQEIHKLIVPPLEATDGVILAY